MSLTLHGSHQIVTLEVPFLVSRAKLTKCFDEPGHDKEKHWEMLRKELEQNKIYVEELFDFPEQNVRRCLVLRCFNAAASTDWEADAEAEEMRNCLQQVLNKLFSRNHVGKVFAPHDRTVDPPPGLGVADTGVRWVRASNVSVLRPVWLEVVKARKKCIENHTYA